MANRLAMPWDETKMVCMGIVHRPTYLRVNVMGGVVVMLNDVVSSKTWSGGMLTGLVDDMLLSSFYRREKTYSN